MLRNHRGDELNIVSGTLRSDSARQASDSLVSFQVQNLDQVLERLHSWYPEAEIVDDAVTRRVRLTDPDDNDIVFYQDRDRDSLANERVYHVATLEELIAGLSEHYYLPPDQENRFVRARARSAFLELACSRVANETNGIPLVIEMDESELSIEAQLLDESDYDSPVSATWSAYPRVNSPIPRQALTVVGTCEEKDGEFSWPSRFVAVGSIAN